MCKCFWLSALRGQARVKTCNSHRAMGPRDGDQSYTLDVILLAILVVYSICYQLHFKYSFLRVAIIYRSVLKLTGNGKLRD